MLDAHGWYVPFAESFTSEALPWAKTGAAFSFEKFPDEADRTKVTRSANASAFFGSVTSTVTHALMTRAGGCVISQPLPASDARMAVCLTEGSSAADWATASNAATTGHDRPKHRYDDALEPSGHRNPIK